MKQLQLTLRINVYQNLNVNNKPTLVTEPTNLISIVTDASRRQSWGSYSHLNLSIRNYKNNSFCIM